ncbi:hypothetical protein VMCG_04511 [Cytospora schulzeri]|uniref:Heterokaryon incompatibility domain-containing protein n=1 Tax=Cytospora schulzeri TaxID=448051 RepID=A0A423WS03_9PEZI|nr:hypothetical protein VMCG_04511 [Valsa malicola]
MDADRSYKYRPLGTPSTIRLIKVLRDRVDSCVTCKVYTYDTQQQPDVKYEALSYVWGNPEHTHLMYLAADTDEQWSPFPLHENLGRFLEHAWQHEFFDRLFWTDCICLNQKDPDEIAQQIPRMGSIYSNADQVVSWLQLDERKSQYLQDCMEMYGRQPPSEHLKDLQGGAYAVANDVYWRRAWIVQEVALAKRVWVIAGSVSMDLSEMWSRMTSLFRGYDFAERQLFRRSSTPSQPFMWVLCKLQEAGGKLPLWKVLFDFGGYESSRPADQVYGLLGMVADNEDGTSPVEHIQVDYDKPLVHIRLDLVYESPPPWRELIELILPLPNYRRRPQYRKPVALPPAVDVLFEYVTKR